MLLEIKVEAPNDPPFGPAPHPPAPSRDGTDLHGQSPGIPPAQ